MKHRWRFALVALLAVLLTACGLQGQQAQAPEQFQQARDVALAFLEDAHPEMDWPAAYTWASDDITAGRVGATVWQFTDSSGMEVTVAQPVVPEVLYNVEVAFGDFAWKGRVDAEGQVETEPVSPTVLTFEAARDAAIAHFVQEHSNLQLPDVWTVIDVSGGLLGVGAVRYVDVGWTVDVQAPVVPQPEYAVRIVHESGARWTGKVLPDGSVLAESAGSFVVDDAQLTHVIGPILANPDKWLGQNVRIVGYYEGWDVFGSAGTAPPLTRSDWVVRDESGAMYVGGGNPVDSLDVSPSEKVEGVLLSLFAEVRVTDGGQPYLWVLSGARIGPIGNAWLEYERSGGIAGFQDRLQIYPDGQAVLDRKGEESDFQLTSEQMDELQAALAAADFFNLDASYLPKDTCCDRFTYTIHYRDPSSGKVHSVYAMDGSVPPELSPVLVILNRLVNQPK